MKNLLITICCLLSCAASAQDSLGVRAITMGGGSREFGIYATRISDNRAALFNITSNCNTATCNHGMAAILIDNNGNVVRYKKIGATTIDIDANKAIATSDGNMLLIGAYGDQSKLLVKLDTFFNVIWTRKLNLQREPNTAILREDVAEVNGVYYVVYNNQITKVTEDGNVLISKYFGPSAGNTSEYNFVNFRTVISLSPNRLFLTGEIQESDGFNDPAFLCVLDTNLNFVRQAKLELQTQYGSGASHSFRISNNRIKIFGHFFNDMYGADVDTNLAVTNVRKYAGTNLYDHSVAYDGGSRFFMSCYEYNTAKIAVFATDLDGDVEWSKFLVNAGGGYFRARGYQVNDCGFAVYSSTRIPNTVKNKGFWAKLNNNGTVAASAATLPLTVTASTLTSVVSNAYAVDSGVAQTVFPSQAFISDNTAATDSLWFKAKNPTPCIITGTGPDLSQVEEEALCSPNPCYGTLQIGSEWKLSEVKQLQVFDIIGRVLLSVDEPGSRVIRLPETIKGIVFVRWMYKGRPGTQRLLSL